MAINNNCVELDLLSIIDDFILETHSPDPSLVLPQSSSAIRVENEDSISTITRPIPTISPSHTRPTQENNKSDINLNNIHFDRKHKLDTVSNICSPPKIARDRPPTPFAFNYNRPTKYSDCPDSKNQVSPTPISLESNLGLAVLQDPWVANVVEHPLNLNDALYQRPKMITQAPTQRHTNHNGVSDVVWDLNHTVTSQNQSSENQVAPPNKDISVDLDFSKHTVTSQKDTILVGNTSTKADSVPLRLKNLNELMDPVPGTSEITGTGRPNSTVTSTIQPKSNAPVINLTDDEVIVALDSNVKSQLNNNPNKYNEPLFQQLIDIFPEADEDFIKELCCHHSQINSIIEIILDMNNTYPKKKNVPSNPSDVNVNVFVGNDLPDKASSSTTLSVTHQNLEFLTHIFPDAEPTFLEIKSKLNDNDLKLFVSELLETNDYPKLKKVPHVKVEELVEDDLGLYTSSFDIKKFLNIIKDPFAYYLDDKRECKISTHCVEFMKRRFRTHSIKLINIKYRDFKYNLSKTCEFLEREPPSRQTKRSEYEIKMPTEVNRSFLQEACFVEHKKEIKDYLDKIVSDRQTAYALAEERGELIECGCCYQELLFEECATCDEGDLFCKTCIRKSAEVRIGDGLTTFPCLIECSSIFSLKLLQDLLEPQVFSGLVKRMQRDEVAAADIEGLEHCPFCDFATIPPPETKIFTCLNPDCLIESCRQCHKTSHIPKRCDEIENDDQERARKYIEDEMTRALVRECYKCKRSFIKSDGCNKMTCTCGARMCYICRQPITNYQHFNGPGGEKKNLCPLYSTEKLLHVDAVADIAKKALDKVKADNPDLKLLHDPSKDLPSVSKASTTLPPGVEEAAGHMVQRLNNFIFPVAAAAENQLEYIPMPPAAHNNNPFPVNVEYAYGPPLDQHPYAVPHRHARRPEHVLPHRHAIRPEHVLPQQPQLVLPQQPQLPNVLPPQLLQRPIARDPLAVRGYVQRRVEQLQRRRNIARWPNNPSN